MHESSLVQALLRQVRQLIQAQGASQATEIDVCVGEFSGCDPELFSLAYAREIADADIGRARLNIRRAKLTGSCNGCGQTFEIQRFRFACPGCTSTDVTTTGGEELVLENVTLEIAP